MNVTERKYCIVSGKKDAASEAISSLLFINWKERVFLSELYSCPWSDCQSSREWWEVTIRTNCCCRFNLLLITQLWIILILVLWSVLEQSVVCYCIDVGLSYEHDADGNVWRYWNSNVWQKFVNPHVTHRKGEEMAVCILLSQSVEKNYKTAVVMSISCNSPARTEHYS